MPRILHLIACASPPSLQLSEGIDAFAAAGWDTCVILTPTAADWLGDDGVAAIADRTGRPVRVRQRRPGETDPFPPPDAIVCAPLTFHTLHAWVGGLNDSTALGNLNRGLGLGVPMVAAPVISAVLRSHPAYETSVQALIRAGVVYLNPDRVIRRDDGSKGMNWRAVAASLNELIRLRDG